MDDKQHQQRQTLESKPESKAKFFDIFRDEFIKYITDLDRTDINRLSNKRDQDPKTRLAKFFNESDAIKEMQDFISRTGENIRELEGKNQNLEGAYRKLEGAYRELQRKNYDLERDIKILKGKNQDLGQPFKNLREPIKDERISFPEERDGNRNSNAIDIGTRIVEPNQESNSEHTTDCLGSIKKCFKRQCKRYRNFVSSISAYATVIFTVLQAITIFTTINKKGNVFSKYSMFGNETKTKIDNCLKICVVNLYNNSTLYNYENTTIEFECEYDSYSYSTIINISFVSFFVAVFIIQLIYYMFKEMMYESEEIID
jgi:hypothetical protein